MSSYLNPSTDDQVEHVSEIDNIDELWFNEIFTDDLADAISQNFILEVEASHSL